MRKILLLVCEKKQESSHAVFAARSFASAKMAYGLVVAEDKACVGVQIGIDMFQTLFDILVYGGFGYTELSGGGAHRGPVLDDVQCQITGALFDGVFHDKRPPRNVQAG